MIIVTGSSGFIGSNVCKHLTSIGYEILYVDDYSIIKRYHKKVGLASDKTKFPEMESLFKAAKGVIHLGAITDTLETDKELLKTWNIEYSKKLWDMCVKHKVPFIYASSAATYGDGSNGFSDETHPDKLKPLNPYGDSKNKFDKYALSKADKAPMFWAGLKFFNVYGPNEDHKGRMASMVFHGYNQIRETKKIKLFKDGEHKRDFVYVKDICYIVEWLLKSQSVSGIFNVGSGKARSFNDLANALFKSMMVKPNIEYIDMPKDLKKTYQSFTEADLTKLRECGYKKSFYTLEEGVEEYINTKTK